MKKKIIGYQSHMFFPFHNDVEFKKALEEFLSKYAYDEDNQTFEDGFQLNCIFYLNGVKERNEFKKEYDAFVNEWDGDVQGSDDFWAYDEIVLEESTKTYEVILTENEYRKVCSVLNESRPLNYRRMIDRKKIERQSAKASMEANPTEEDVEMYGELLDVKIQKDRPRMRGMKTHYVISSYYGDEEPTQIMVRNDDSMYVFPNGGDIPTVKDLWNIIKDYSDNYVEIEN